ncbi:MAG: uracil phosphoribosyltransferase [Spirochaetaceae bacterium]|nr:MAG: uracil phosphoribosyltransferase [Spirochaetaceae bacterium]
MKQIVLQASDLDGYLTEEDKQTIAVMDNKFAEAMALFPKLGTDGASARKQEARSKLIALYNEMGEKMQEITRKEPSIHVYSFETPRSSHGEASRLIAKLRDVRTETPEFVYYIQRAYELLFNLAFSSSIPEEKNYIFVDTPVDIPTQNYAVHKIPDIDEKVGNSVMCVMLRAALLPSMIVSKEIQEYSSNDYVTPFALFRISRDDTKEERNMAYILDLERSYFDLEVLDGKDLFFADPMNATGGSLVTIVKYLIGQGIKPRSITFLNVISVLKGSLRIVRAIDNSEIYTLWMDPSLNNMAYIMPGLGDAGDRINGEDLPDQARNIIQLIADYGVGITSLYRAQVRKIEATVLG